jgi:hypothetical protein
MVDFVGYWLHKVAGFGLEIFAILILWHGLHAPPMAFTHTFVTAVIAVLLSLLGLWLVIRGERLSRRNNP